MKICVITTVAQHYKGFEIHLRNLKWALKKYEYKIIVQTFKQNNIILNDEVFEIVNYNKNRNDFCYFWEDASKIIKKEIDHVDYFLFTEQDIFFTEELRFDKYKIQVNLHSSYLSIYNKNKKFIYPRIWEGATVISKDYLKKAIEDNINFGNSKKIPHRLIKDEWFTSNSALHLNFTKVKYYIENTNFLDKKNVDTLFEFTLYCLEKNFPYELKSNNYDYGDQVVHFRGLDGIVRENKNVYNSPNEIINMKKNSRNKNAWKTLAGGCAFVFLACKLYNKTKAIKKIIKEDENKNLYKKLTMLKKRSKEWMLKEEIDCLNWCVNLLENKIKIL